MGLFFNRRDNKEETGKVIDLTDGESIGIRAFCPQCLDDARGIADTVTGCGTAVVNFALTDRLISRRIMDYISGVAYTMNAEINRIATGTFLITPCSADFSGSLDDYGSVAACAGLSEDDAAVTEKLG